MGGLQQLQANLDALRQEVLASVEDLSEDEINRRPQGLDLTIGIMVRHLAGSERFWITERVGGTPVHRDRDAEFAYDRVAKAGLVAAMQAAGEETRRVLARVTPETLREEFEWHNARRTREWAVVHVVEHYAYHHGQIRTYRKLVKA